MLVGLIILDAHLGVSVRILKGTPRHHQNHQNQGPGQRDFSVISDDFSKVPKSVSFVCWFMLDPIQLQLLLWIHQHKAKGEIFLMSSNFTDLATSTKSTSPFLVVNSQPFWQSDHHLWQPTTCQSHLWHHTQAGEFTDSAAQVKAPRFHERVWAVAATGSSKIVGNYGRITARNGGFLLGKSSN